MLFGADGSVKVNDRAFCDGQTLIYEFLTRETLDGNPEITNNEVY